MIQAPQTQYIPAAQYAAPYAGQGAVNTQQYQQPMQQLPGTFYNYPTSSAYAPANTVSTEKAQYNGVNIEVINPQGQGISPFAGYQMPAQFVPVQQPVYQTPVIQQPVPAPVYQQPAPAQPAPVETPAPQIVQPEPAGPVVAAAAPVAQIAQAPVAQQPVQAPVVEQPAAPATNISPVAFANRLKSDDADVQLSALEEVAETVKNKDAEGKALVDSEIVDALVGIIGKDTTALEGPSPEIIELRQKLNNGEELSVADKEKANTSTPLEKAEQNKQYALYTLSYIHNRIIDETAKAGVETPALKDLPAIETVIDAAKSNPEPMVRLGALSSLSHIARPEYKEDLTTIFNLAKEDEDPDVAQEATRAVEALQ